MRITAAALLVLAAALPARGQALGLASPARAERRLCGRVEDFTSNHGEDRRIPSTILGMPRDCYVYLPPGYDPRRAYPLVLFFHMARVDEHYFIGSKLLRDLDDLILRGAVPPMVLAAPDGTYSGRNHIGEVNSLYVNGCGGRVEDFILQELVPFLQARYSIRPEREAHAIVGTSSGGYGAMSMALRHRDRFGAVATLAGPLNLRYSNCDGEYSEDFDPATYRWKADYDPDEVVGKSYFGPARAGRFISPIFGADAGAVGRIIATNPADLLFRTGLKPGELAMYVNFGTRDDYNFDAQNESFVWLAASLGVEVAVGRDASGRHDARYFRENLPCALLWLGRHLLPPTP